jgi:acyl-CoA synthetase (AMP-forming)/AMP-acid ligase II
MILELLNGNPSHLAVVVAGGGPVVTYDELRRQVDDLAGKLNQFGLGRGDRIASAAQRLNNCLVSGCVDCWHCRAT